MPGRIDGPATSSRCKKCEEQGSSIIMRGDAFCSSCFVSIVQTKIVKKLGSFGVRQATPDLARKLLLPLSFGPSSLSLLYVIDQHLQRQLSRTGRAGYELHVLHVRDPGQNSPSTVDACMQRVRELFPRHAYVVKSLVDQDAPSNPVEPDHESAELESTASGIQLQGSARPSAGLPSATSQLDMSEIARTRLIASEALNRDCESVLWGHCTTRLAEKLLAETAKGRGFALPWLAQDGMSPFGVDFLYPVRDLLKKEVRSFVSALPPAVAELCITSTTERAPLSRKATTIDGLMNEYFESVEESYPSIVTNVMRTSTKLAAPPGETLPCKSCNMPVSKDALDLTNWAGVQEPSQYSSSAATADHVCYGCATSLLDYKKTAV